VWVIVVAGGDGRRFGGPKQFLPLAGRPVAAWSVDAARSVADGVVLVVPSRALPAAGEGRSTGSAGGDGDAGSLPAPAMGADLMVAGGPSRSASVRAGLAAVPDDAAVIVVHDAARPLATGSLFAAVVAALGDGVDGAIPVLAVVDTVKRTLGGRVVDTIDRDGLVTVQTPQAFTAAALRAAHRSDHEATDDAALVERTGATVRTVAGEPHNLKLTGPEDLVVAEALVVGTGR